jgi:hypothetical protein
MGMLLFVEVPPFCSAGVSPAMLHPVTSSEKPPARRRRYQSQSARVVSVALAHYFALWVAFLACRQMSVAVQITIFGILLPHHLAHRLLIGLYQAVEAPLTAVGAKISDKLKLPSCVAAMAGTSAEGAV